MPPTGLPGCGSLTWELMNQDNTPLDSAIFTADFNSSPLKLDIYTTAILSVGWHPLVTSVAYSNFPNDKAIANWKVEIKSCSKPSLDPQPTIWQDEVYVSGDPENTFSWAPTPSLPTDCPTVWSLEMSDLTPIDT